MLKVFLQRAIGLLSAAERAKLFEYISTAGRTSITSVRSLWNWVAANPLSVSVVAQGLYQLWESSGTSPDPDKLSELEKAMRSDPNASQILDGLSSGIRRQLVTTHSTAHAHAESAASGLGGEPTAEAARATERIRMGNTLKRFFGSLENAILVRDAMMTLKDDDYAFLRALERAERMV